MSFVNIKRVLRLGIVNFWRNLWLSLGSVLILTLTLITITVSVIQNYDIRQTTEAIKGKLDITVYFNDSVPESDIKDLQAKLQSRPDIKSVIYISKDDALKVWETLSTSNTIKDLVSQENNPLPRSLQLRTYESESLESVAATLKSPSLESKITRVSYDTNKKIIQELIARNKEITQNGMISSLIFMLISLIVIVNTMRIIILTRRKEFDVMRLVGASDFYVRAPLIIEALIIGCVAALLSTALLYVGILYDVPIVPSFSQYFGSGVDTIGQMIIQNIVLIFSLQLVAAFVITVVTTIVSMHRYLKR